MKLVKMTQEEFDHWAPRSRNQYAKDKERANGLTRKEAEEIAEKDFLQFLPEGLESKDNFLYSMNEQETNVGYLWFCIRGADDNRKAFLCDIIVEERYRGKKFGKNAMLLLEDEIRRRGLNEIGLHVFGFNEIATRLYQSLGYEITDLVMSKAIPTSEI